MVEGGGTNPPITNAVIVLLLSKYRLSLCFVLCVFQMPLRGANYTLSMFFRYIKINILNVKEADAIIET